MDKITEIETTADFPTCYLYKNRPDLADKALNVLNILPPPNVPANAPCGADTVFRLGNAYRIEYRYHLMGFTEQPDKLHEAAIEFLNQGDVMLSILNQDNVYLLDELVRNELFEIVPKLLEINQELSNAIERELPHIDASFLRDQDKAAAELKKLLDTLKIRKKHGFS